MVSPSYADKSREARDKHHMDDEENQKFDNDLKCSCFYKDLISVYVLTNYIS